MAEAATDETTLPPERAAELVREGAQVVDVRGDNEHEAGHIPGDRHIRFDRLKDEAGTLDPGKPLLLYCRSGDRSSPAADALRASGFQAFNIEGGLLGWVERGLPLEPADGHVADRDVLPPS
jgi:rhodanese-related sulfurtransferase